MGSGELLPRLPIPRPRLYAREHRRVRLPPLSSFPHNLTADRPLPARSTKLSFEFYGAFLARSWLLPNPDTASQDEKDLADSVTESICRHTNFIEGKCSTHVQLIQLGTLCELALGLPP